MDWYTLRYALFAGLLFLVACGGTGEELTGFGECTFERADWRQCKDGKIQWCHAVTEEDSHFHWGADCAAMGLSCVNVNNEGKAACVDDSKTCAVADQKCENNTAYFCVNGKLAQEVCGTAKECHVDGGETPHCVTKSTECSGHGTLKDNECVCDEGYKQNPSDKQGCISEVSFPQQSCDMFAGNAMVKSVVDSFSKFKEAHAELDTPYEVTLPDNKASYVHFPVAETGEYVIFLSEPEVFDSFMHRNETDIAPNGGVPNEKCKDAIKDHWHGGLTFDGTGDATKVPYILRFKAISGGKSIKFMIRRKN